MTTVRTPRAAAGTVAVAGGDRDVQAVDALVLLAEDVPDQQVVDVREAAPGDRLRRLQRRRRLLREEFLAVMFLVLVLAITVGVLAMQWLGSGGPVPSALASGPAPSSVMNALSGGTA
jgi:hypothetical protein